MLCCDEDVSHEQESLETLLQSKPQTTGWPAHLTHTPDVPDDHKSTPTLHKLDSKLVSQI